MARISLRHPGDPGGMWEELREPVNLARKECISIFTKLSVKLRILLWMWATSYNRIGRSQAYQ